MSQADEAKTLQTADDPANDAVEQLAFAVPPGHQGDRRRAIWAVLVGATALAAVLSFLTPRLVNVENAVVSSFYFVEWLHLALFVNALWLFVQAGQVDLRALIRRNAWLLATGVATTGLVFLCCRPEFRVLADETNLIGSSLSLHLNRGYRNITEGYFYYDAFHPIASVLDKRPPLFSFLMALLHGLLGFNPYHGFVVNFAVSAATIVLFGAIGRHLGGRTFSLYAIMMILASPIFVLDVTSSGYEALNHLLVVATLWQCLLFLERPEVLRLELLVLTGIFAAEVRYESVLLLLPIGAGALLRWRQLKWTPGALRLAALPLLCIPLNWQKQLTSAINDGDPTAKVFSLQHLVTNLGNWLRFHFETPANYPTSVGLNVLATATAALWCYETWRTRRASPRARAWLLGLTLAVLPIICVQLAYYLGDPRGPAAQRITLTYGGLFSLMAAYGLYRVAEARGGALMAAALAAFLVIQGFTIANLDEQGHSLLLFREYKATLDYIRSFPRGGTLIVTDRPGMYAAHQYGAISHERLNGNPEETLQAMRRKLYTNVFVTQKIAYGQPERPDPVINAKVHLEPVVEFQNDRNYFVRFSKIVLDDSPATPAAPIPAAPPKVRSDWQSPARPLKAWRFGLF